MNEWGGKPLPISATCFVDGKLFVRLSGAAPRARGRAGPDRRRDPRTTAACGRAFASRRTHSSPRHGDLWRLSVPSATPPLGLGPTLIEWGGAQRWVWGTATVAEVRESRKQSARPCHGVPPAWRARGRVHAAQSSDRQDSPQSEAAVRPARHLQSRTDVRRPLDRGNAISPTGSRTRPQGKEAEAILRKCVHCGFCTATCPTYQLLGDELDGPRGRIYLIKQMLEGAAVTRTTQLHLDRCLTCRNCESTCPSGVQYGRLVDIGRDIVEKRVPREGRGSLQATAAAEGAAAPGIVRSGDAGSAVWCGPCCRERAEGQDASAASRAQPWPTKQHARKMLVLAGLRAAHHGAEHQRRHGACAGPLRHSADRSRPGGLLRSAALSPERAGRRARRHAAQYRCMVAVRRAGRRGDRHDRFGMRGDGEGVWPSSARRPALCARKRSAFPS